MSRATSLITSYLQAFIFGLLALRCILAWLRERDNRSGHLAAAAGLFALSSLMGALTTTFIDQTKLEVVPRWEQVASSIVLFVSIYFFLVFLSDFVRFPRWVHGLVIVITLIAIAFSFIERPDLKLNLKTFQLEKITGVDNPISYKVYIGYVLLYLAVAFGVLAVAFLVYGFRSDGLARFRMISIGSGFLVFCIVIGLLPRILFGDPSATTVKTLLNILTYVALAVGPLLLVGFAPPKFIRDRFPESSARLGA